MNRELVFTVWQLILIYLIIGVIFTFIWLVILNGYKSIKGSNYIEASKPLKPWERGLFLLLLTIFYPLFVLFLMLSVVISEQDKRQEEKFNEKTKNLMDQLFKQFEEKSREKPEEEENDNE